MKYTLPSFLLIVIVFAGSQLTAQPSRGTGSLTKLNQAALQYQHDLGPAEWEKLQARLASLNQDLSKKGALTVPGHPKKLSTGYGYKEFYDWDLYFENIYLSYYGISDFCFTNFEAFMALQKPDGFIPRSFGAHNWGRNQMFKPFLAQIAVLGSEQRGNDYEWLRAGYYDQLRKYINRWFAYDGDHNGLPTWESSDASGMDNQVSRAGMRGSVGSYQSEGVDLACELHRDIEAMAVIARHLGKKDDANEYTRKADKLAALIESTFWDDKDGFYYDRNEKTGQIIIIKSVAGFFPLWAGVASSAHAKRLIEEHLLNPKEFWLKYPVASYAATEAEYYQGSRHGECNWRGCSWIPANYMIMHGLIRYGYQDAARGLARRNFEMVLEQNPVTREYYDADTGTGNGMNPFWGWSSLAYLMPLEATAGYDPMQLDTPLEPLLSDLLKAGGPQF